jgi:hypothetical protein
MNKRVAQRQKEAAGAISFKHTLILAIDREETVHVCLQQQSGYLTVLDFLMFLLFLINHPIISLADFSY